MVPITSEYFLFKNLYSQWWRIMSNSYYLWSDLMHIKTASRFSCKHLSLDDCNSKFLKSYLFLSLKNYLLTLFCHWVIPQPWQWQLIEVINNHGSLKKKKTPNSSEIFNSKAIWTSEIIYVMFSLKKSDLWHPNLHKY